MIHYYEVLTLIARKNLPLNCIFLRLYCRSVTVFLPALSLSNCPSLLASAYSTNCDLYTVVFPSQRTPAIRLSFLPSRSLTLRVPLQQRNISTSQWAIRRIAALHLFFACCIFKEGVMIASNADEKFEKKGTLPVVHSFIIYKIIVAVFSFFFVAEIFNKLLVNGQWHGSRVAIRLSIRV